MGNVKSTASTGENGHFGSKPDTKLAKLNKKFYFNLNEHLGRHTMPGSVSNVTVDQTRNISFSTLSEHSLTDEYSSLNEATTTKIDDDNTLYETTYDNYASLDENNNMDGNKMSSLSSSTSSSSSAHQPDVESALYANVNHLLTADLSSASRKLNNINRLINKLSKNVMRNNNNSKHGKKRQSTVHVPPAKCFDPCEEMMANLTDDSNSNSFASSVSCNTSTNSITTDHHHKHNNNNIPTYDDYEQYEHDAESGCLVPADRLPSHHLPVEERPPPPLPPASTQPNLNLAILKLFTGSPSSTFEPAILIQN